MSPDIAKCPLGVRLLPLQSHSGSCPQTPSSPTLARPLQSFSRLFSPASRSRHVRGSALRLRCHQAALRPRCPPGSVEGAALCRPCHVPTLLTASPGKDTALSHPSERGGRAPSPPRGAVLPRVRAHRPVSGSRWLTRPLALQVWPECAQGTAWCRGLRLSPLLVSQLAICSPYRPPES